MAINMLNLIMLILLYIINLAHKEKLLHIIGFIFLILMIWFLLVLLIFHLIIVLTSRKWRLLEVSLIDQTLIKLLLLFLLLFFLVYFYLTFLLLCLERGAYLVGLYSFYKIIKDVIRSILGNKAWRYTLIIALIVLLFTLYSTKVSAADLRPWNVYTNTTEYNWSRLTNLNFVGGSASLPYKMFEIKPEQTYYLYNPNSNNGNIHYYCYTSNDVNRPQVLIEDTSYNAALHLDYNFELPSGYVDIPYNTLFTPQMTFYVFINDSCELYLLDDKYSNIETYNELSALAQDLHTLLAGPMPYDTINGLLGYISGGQFINNANYNTIYLPISKDTTYNVSFNAVPGTSFNSVAFGSTSSVPAVGVAFTDAHFGSYYNNATSFSFKGSDYQYKYFVITYHKDYFSNFNVSTGSNVMTTIENEGSATRGTLTDSSISQDSTDYSLPSDSTNDITQDGFGSIFDRIRATFTSGSATPITITIPFTSKSFTISKQSVYGSANLGLVGTLIQSFWWFVVSLFIVKDIFKKIESIKSGNIEFAETTNIKEDIL